MTSSYRATGQASVRTTPAGQISPSGAWFLDELGLPGATTPNERTSKPMPAEISAEERARLIDEGYARGFADGEVQARAAAQGSLSDALGVIREITAALSEVAAVAPAILEENISALAIIVARQIVSREVSLERELVANLVRRALTEFPIDQTVRIRVNPVDLSLLTMNGGAEQSGSITGKRDASWLADPRVARGGCLVEGRDRIIDGRVDTALERAYRRMAQVDAS
jgi:flagellar biosynthesis/type III secretory pathway protein FliH